jgi:hypothetical protein
MSDQEHHDAPWVSFRYYCELHNSLWIHPIAHNMDDYCRPTLHYTLNETNRVDTVTVQATLSAANSRIGLGEVPRHPASVHGEYRDGCNS